MIFRSVIFSFLFACSILVSKAQNQDSAFRIIPQYSESELREIALGASPPFENREFKPNGLVELASLIPDMRYDIRYATTNNFMGMRFYLQKKAFLQIDAANALKDAADQFRKLGLGIVVFDAYRPWFVTKMFWEATPDSLRHFVADPASGSRHNRGCAIDMGLYDLRSGKVLAMPSGYDEFTERAYADFDGAKDIEEVNRQLLIEVMKNHGFTVYQYEWWHFDYSEWQDYPIMNIPFKDIE